MSMFILCGLDSNRERKMRAKKHYISLVKFIRDSNKKIQLEENTKRLKLLPENCLSYAISLLAHNFKIDSLKDETSIKHLKE